MRVPEVVVFENDNRCYDLRKAGLTYRQIASALDCSESRAYNGVQRVMRRISLKQSEDNADVLRMELDRLDALMTNMWPMTMPHDITSEDGDTVRVPPSYEAVDRVLKIMDRRAKLLGLDQVVLSLQTRGNQGAVPSTVTAGATGEITPADEAMSLLKVMAEAGVIDPDMAHALRTRMGLVDDVIEAESHEMAIPEIGPGDDIEDAEIVDGGPFLPSFDEDFDDDAS